MGIVGSAFTPALAAHHPLLLLFLEARDRNLLLARHVAVVPFVVVSTLRRFSSDPLYFLLGRRYGDAAIRWLERHGGGALVRVTERAFRRAAYPMLVIFPGAVVCALAGEIGIDFRLFVAITIARTLVVVALLRVATDAFAGPIDAVIRFFDRYTTPATIVSVALVVGWFVWERAKIRKYEECEKQ